MASSRTVRVGLLVCGTLSGPVEATHGGYHEVYSYYWKTTTPHNCNAQVVIESFNIKKMEFPDEKRLDEFDIFMVTGSATSAYDDTIQWVRELLAFLKGLINNHPKVKLCGICFGHQIVCRALGGECAPNGQWEIGPTTIELSDMGKSIFGVDKLSLQEMHRDHVPLESFSKQFASGELELVGSSGPTGNQGVIKFYSSSKDARTARDIHVLTLQGHPEFCESIVTGIVRQRVDDMGVPTVTDYWGSKGGNYDFKPLNKAITGRRWKNTDGLNIVSQVLWKMLNVEPDVDVSSERSNMQKTRDLDAIAKVESDSRIMLSMWWKLISGFYIFINVLRRIVNVVSW